MLLHPQLNVVGLASCHTERVLRYAPLRARSPVDGRRRRHNRFRVDIDTLGDPSPTTAYVDSLIGTL